MNKQEIKELIKEIIIVEISNLSPEADYVISQLIGIQNVLNTGMGEADKKSATYKYLKKYKSEVEKLKKKMLQEFPDKEEINEKLKEKVEYDWTYMKKTFIRLSSTKGSM